MTSQETTLEEVRERLIKLEGQNRRLKQMGAVALVVAASLLVMAQALRTKTVEADVVEAIRVEANEFILKDKNGNVRARLSSPHPIGSEQREQPLAAIEALKRCIAASRKDTLPRFYLGKLYFRLEMLDDAYTVLSSLTGRASYAPTLHYLLGRIHERRGQHPEANEAYRHVIKEMDLVQLEYVCQACSETVMEWTDRCPECGDWQTIEVNFREEISLDDLGLSAAPIYSTRS